MVMTFQAFKVHISVSYFANFMKITNKNLPNQFENKVAKNGGRGHPQKRKICFPRQSQLICGLELDSWSRL